MRRFLGDLGKRFAQYVVADGEFATAPFLHMVGDLGLWVVARLKDYLPELMIRWLLVVLALTIERPYRLRYLRRGLQPRVVVQNWSSFCGSIFFRRCPADTR